MAPQDPVISQHRHHPSDMDGQSWGFWISISGQNICSPLIRFVTFSKIPISGHRDSYNMARAIYSCTYVQYIKVYIEIFARNSDLHLDS